MSKPAARLLVRARFLMIAGLVVSVLGNRLIDGTFNGLVAAGLIASVALVLLESLNEVVVFAFPLYARVLKRFSPDTAMIVSDLTEAVVSTVLVIVILLIPDWAIGSVIFYLIFTTLLLPVTDISEEMYGAKVAEVEPEANLRFNAHLHSLLAFSGFVIASPLGAFLAGISIPLALGINVVLSLIGAFIRGRARKKYPMGAIVDVDMDDFELVGSGMRARQFFHDLFASGPTSPLIEFGLSMVSSLTGTLMLVWVARQASIPTTDAMALVVAVFGISATLGPQVGRFMGHYFGTARSLRLTAVLSALNLAVLLGALLLGDPGFIWGSIFIFVNGTLSRSRAVLLQSHRQTFFRGEQYTRIMSWSFTFGAAGTIIGLNLGYFAGLPEDPRLVLAIGIILWLILYPFVTSSRGSKAR
ncbi:MFS transporter [Actinomyces minihominis]|uniref:MFS transporter n=1 Tax=Actinomyces minihominis TaxID=2002838 RepID=UPI000C082BAB|nr:MFS transporter [Actinomyces minihominis]